MIGLKKIISTSQAHTWLSKLDTLYSKYFLQLKINGNNNKLRYFGTCFWCRSGKYSLEQLTRDQVLGIRNIGYNFKMLALSSNVRYFSDDTDAKTIQKALDDEEFKNILKDFAKDFDVKDNSAVDFEDVQEKSEESNEKNSDSDTHASGSSNEALEIYQAIYKDRFKEFKDTDSDIIYSYEEEQKQLENENFFHIDKEYNSRSTIREVKRGITGVYDIEELIPILREERLFDISVIEIPRNLHYADYLVLATAKSLRHIKAVTEFVLKFYKMKKNSSDPFINIEGEKLGTWKAMDMGNIVLHVFLDETRAMYDIESLWLLDQKYDSGGSIEGDDVMNIMQEELDFMNCLNPKEIPLTENEDVK